MKHLLYTLSLVLLASCATNTPKSYDWQADLHHRLSYDFNKSREDVETYIRRYLPNVTDDQLSAWEATGALECMQLDGQKRYFQNAAPNLFRIDPACVAVKNAHDGDGLSNREIDDQVNIPEVVREASAVKPGAYPLGAPKRMHVTYTLTVKADAVPAGQTVRCWLPFPRTDEVRQQGVKLLSTSQKNYRRAPQHATHSTLYMEQKAVAGQPTVFSETFEYVSYGAKFHLTPENCGTYNTKSKIYREFTAQREKHIVFTPRLRELAARLTAGETNPYRKAERIFRWVDHFPWASAREYSTIDNIPEYVLQNGHGDCGQVSLLFITLCRISGIPARFESGFMMHPHEQNLHDWAEIYFENIGWVPVDQSFGVCANAQTEDEALFFLGGIDSWRMIVNRDFGRALFPKKKYPRSETVDFQRGEVEWAGGNLYFDQWNYHLDVKYL
jgi:transglutaminase-like putative cysteine protease